VSEIPEPTCFSPRLVTSANSGKNRQHCKNEKADCDEIHHSAKQLETFEPIEMNARGAELAALDFVHDRVTRPGDPPPAHGGQFFLEILKIFAPANLEHPKSLQRNRHCCHEDGSNKEEKDSQNG